MDMKFDPLPSVENRGCEYLKMKCKKDSIDFGVGNKIKKNYIVSIWYVSGD